MAKYRIFYGTPFEVEKAEIALPVPHQIEGGRVDVIVWQGALEAHARRGISQ